MMVFLTEQPYSFNLNGAASLSSSHLRMLRQRFPDELIRVLLFSEKSEFWAEEPDFPREGISVQYISIPYITYRPLSPSSLISNFFKPDFRKLIRSVFLVDAGREKALAQMRDTLAGTGNHSLIWCEHLMPLLYLQLLPDFRAEQVKLVYSHHDFQHKLLLVREWSVKNYFRAILLKKTEQLAAGMAYACVAGSLSEAREMDKLLPENRKTQFLPCFFPPQTFGETAAEDQLSIYHLGTSAATANRKGLGFFFEKLYPAVKEMPVRLEFFGEVKKYILSRFPRIEENPRLIFHEFVPDLSRQMKQGMIHILPYAGFTGTRTRIPALVRYRPCLLGFENLRDSYPFLTSGKNAMIARNEKEFAAFLLELIANEKLRKTISENVAEDMKKFEEEINQRFTI